ncbi:protein SOMBRERO isoform X2 [Brachypodium distachyon]|uniref:NAC domain-containing protein n=1 Tax=Brachypodium distachyon TaxID=15368 RepID=A0A0Q3HBL1_BRADI|nr:protein SOMBRERO isoform X2 [Brachypodium distachyon]KQJ85499.1 hypothetical protein BRADI_5g27467v3 [Brachypodium distachyon]|eukprot:XP_010240666.1 protein SOMBRERO isoform X2 [Brachypodium distachyon]
MLFGIYKYGPKLSFPSYQTWIDLTIITRLLLNSLISFSLSRPPTTKLQASTIASSIKYRSSSSSSSSSCLASRLINLELEVNRSRAGQLAFGGQIELATSMEHLQQQQDDQSCCVPPGFRFHPTEEELVGYYLARKVASQKIDLDIIQEVDLYRIEPWDLQERCGRQYGAGSGHEEDSFRSSSSSAEWYFFSFKDRKYPSGTRTNRATAAGFWKATGRDKPVLRGGHGHGRGAVIGMRKTLVFYRGRAPNGRKTEWIMHEYRLQSSEHAPTPEEGWVVCRAFHKPLPNMHHHRPMPFVFPGADHYAAAAGGPPPAGYYINDIDARLNGHGGDLLNYLHPAPVSGGGGGGFVFPGNGSVHGQMIVSEDLQVESKKHVNIFSSIPQLIESPVTATIDDDDQAGAGQQAAGGIDWNFLDSLLSSTSSASQLIHDSSSQSQLMMHLQQQH